MVASGGAMPMNTSIGAPALVTGGYIVKTPTSNPNMTVIEVPRNTNSGGAGGPQSRVINLDSRRRVIVPSAVGGGGGAGASTGGGFDSFRAG
jgi:hypothetical protein